jgi:hypothetical protein
MNAAAPTMTAATASRSETAMAKRALVTCVPGIAGVIGA